MKIFVTGATGFIGSNLIPVLAQNQNINIIGLVRDKKNLPKYRNVEYILGDVLNVGALKEKLGQIDVVIHTAGRAHVMREKAIDPLHEFRKLNSIATAELAKLAAHCGVKRFIYLSSLKVHGEYTDQGSAFTNQSPYDPKDPYAISKLEAELELQKLNIATDMETVIIRPPIVYGAGVKGNLHKLLFLIKLGVPLPFSGVSNSRSFVSVKNLIDLICICTKHPNAANKAFLVSDGVHMSTAELISGLAIAGKRNVKFFNIPVALLAFVFYVIRQRGLYDRLCRSLMVDISFTCDQLSWRPTFDDKTAFKSLWFSH